MASPLTPVLEAAPSRARRQAAAGRRRVTILGSTGSVGLSTIDLLEHDRGRYEVVSLAARSKSDELISQAQRLRPEFVAIEDRAQLDKVAAALRPLGIEVGGGPEAVLEAAEREADWVMAAIVGAAGLAPTLKALRHGGLIALANKECLVCAGSLLMAEAERHGAKLLPVDSEHNAIFQVLDAARPETVDRLILTASGGPFREASLEAMARATPEQAVAHPRWSMGAKISVDSATMMNKGLEVIEASYLFDIPETRIDVLIHPQSVVHSLVAYIDGSVLAQLGTPDMRTPIAHTLAWPTRMATPTARLDLAAIGSLDFARPAADRFPALDLARAALCQGGLAPTILNAANEVAVEAFLKRRIGFLEIVAIVEETLSALAGEAAGAVTNLSDIWALDQRSRRFAETCVAARA